MNNQSLDSILENNKLQSILNVEMKLSGTVTILFAIHWILQYRYWRQYFRTPKLSFFLIMLQVILHIQNMHLG